MKRLIALLVVLAPQVAWAHPGHEHFVNPTVHHGIQLVLVLACIAMAAVVARLLQARFTRLSRNTDVATP